MPNPASTSDLAARWRPIEASEVLLFQTRLDDAWWLLLGRRPNLEADLATQAVPVQTVVRVVSDIALRVLRNPDGKRSESIDDYTYTRDELVSSGALHVTTSELADVTPGRRIRGSVRLVAYDGN